MEDARQGTSNHGSSDQPAGLEEGEAIAVVVVDSEQGSAGVDTNGAEDLDKAVKKKKIDHAEEESGEKENRSCVIDLKAAAVKGEKYSRNEEIVCRICHLSSDQPETVTELIQLGCNCKDELGTAHTHCAEVWFKVKGNRLCEICGETAKNITGILDNGYIENWNERRSYSRGPNTSSDRGCWRSQPFCNFLMGCLVIAFVLPWFFRINLF